MIDPNKTYYVKDIAKLLRTERQAVKRWINNGELKATMGKKEIITTINASEVKGQDLINYLEIYNDPTEI